MIKFQRNNFRFKNSVLNQIEKYFKLQEKNSPKPGKINRKYINENIYIFLIYMTHKKFFFILDRTIEVKAY